MLIGRVRVVGTPGIGGTCAILVLPSSRVPVVVMIAFFNNDLWRWRRGRRRRYRRGRLLATRESQNDCR
jgi:hypothetical protein